MLVVLCYISQINPGYVFHYVVSMSARVQSIPLSQKMMCNWSVRVCVEALALIRAADFPDDVLPLNATISMEVKST